MEISETVVYFVKTQANIAFVTIYSTVTSFKVTTPVLGIPVFWPVMYTIETYIH